MSEKNFLQTPIEGKRKYKKPFPTKGEPEQIEAWAKKANAHEDSEHARIYASQLEKMKEIAEVYEIDPEEDGVWYKLAFKLASEKYMGLRVKPIPKTKTAHLWPKAVGEFLFCQVTLLREARPDLTSYEKAIRILMKQPFWSKHLSLNTSVDLSDSEIEKIRKKVSEARRSEPIENILKQVKHNPNLIHEYHDELEKIIANAYDCEIQNIFDEGIKSL